MGAALLLVGSYILVICFMVSGFFCACLCYFEECEGGSVFGNCIALVRGWSA